MWEDTLKNEDPDVSVAAGAVLLSSADFKWWVVIWNYVLQCNDHSMQFISGNIWRCLIQSINPVSSFACPCIYLNTEGLINKCILSLKVNFLTLVLIRIEFFQLLMHLNHHHAVSSSIKRKFLWTWWCLFTGPEATVPYQLLCKCPLKIFRVKLNESI